MGTGAKIVYPSTVKALQFHGEQKCGKMLGEPTRNN